MASLEMVHSAQADVAKLQTTLAGVQTGLDHVESAVVTAHEARRGLRRFVRVVLVVIVVMVIVKVVSSKKQHTDEPET